MTERDLLDSVATPTPEEMADYLIRVREGMISRSDEVRVEREATRKKRKVLPDPAHWHTQLQALHDAGVEDTCIAYCRLSSALQQEGFGMEAQRRVCAQWAALNTERGKVDLLIEDVSSGSDEERPGMSFIRAAFLTGKVAVVICYKRDRIARSQYLSEVINQEAKNNGVEIISATETLPEDGFLSDMFRQVLQSWGEYESSIITERMTAGARVAATVNGIYMGGFTPYGYRRVAGRLEIEEAESAVIRLMFVLYSRGYNPIAIAEFLNRREIPKRSGNGAGWGAGQVRRAIMHESAYRGECVFSDKYLPSEVVVFHQAILPHRALAEERTYLFNNRVPLPTMSRVPDAFLTAAPFRNRKRNTDKPEAITYADARTLVLAYEWHVVDGMTYPAIVDKLNELGIPPVKRLWKWSVENLQRQFDLRYRWAPAAVEMGVENASVALPEDRADVEARVAIEQKAIERIHELYAEGIGFREIALALDTEGHLSLSVKKWDCRIVRRMMRGTRRRSQILLARMDAREQ